MQSGSSLLLDAIADPAVLTGTVLTSTVLLTGLAARVAEWVMRRR